MLYLNENVYLSLVKYLVSEGIHSIHTCTVGNRGLSDEAQLEYAQRNGHVLFSFNRKHYRKLHSEWTGIGKNHCGIIVSRQIEPAFLAKRIKEFLDIEYPKLSPTFFASLSSLGPNRVIY